MAHKFTYSRTIVTDEGSETFTAVECASFDEAQRIVERGVYDRKLELASNKKSTSTAAPSASMPHNKGNDASTGNPSAPVPSTSGGA